MKGRASRAVYMRLQPSLLSPPSDPEEREKKKGAKKREQKKTAPLLWPQSIRFGAYQLYLEEFYMFDSVAAATVST